jgi:O-antigen/teichoic acid export membrane protein
MNSMKEESLLLTASNIILYVVRFPVLLYAMKLVGPGQYGIWVILSPLITYSLLFSLRAPNAMNRLVPILKGLRGFTRIEEIRNVTLFLMLAAVSIMSIIIFLVVLLGGNRNLAEIVPVFVALSYSSIISSNLLCSGRAQITYLIW